MADYQVTVQTSVQDAEVWHNLARDRARPGLLRMLQTFGLIAVCIFLPATVAIWLAKSANQEADVMAAVGCFATFFFGLLTLRLENAISVRRAIRKRMKAGWNKPSNYRLTDEGLEVWLPDMVRSLVYWPAIDDVVERDGLLMPVLHGDVAYLIPDRCFASQTDADLFGAELRRRWLAAKGQPS